MAGTITGSVDNNSTGATQASVSLSGLAFDPSAPLITVAPGTLNFPATGTGTNAASLTYTLTAINLTNNVSLTTTAPYSLSIDNITYLDAGAKVQWLGQQLNRKVTETNEIVYQYTGEQKDLSALSTSPTREPPVS